MKSYYGIAIFQNPWQLHDMRKYIGAVLWSCSDV